MTRVGILSWDWRAQPDLNTLRVILAEFADTLPLITEVDGGGQDYVWAFTRGYLSQATLMRAYERYEQGTSCIVRLEDS